MKEKADELLHYRQKLKIKIIFDKKQQLKLEQERLKQLHGDVSSEESEKEDKQDVFSDVDSDEEGGGEEGGSGANGSPKKRSPENSQGGGSGGEEQKEAPEATEQKQVCLC